MEAVGSLATVGDGGTPVSAPIEDDSLCTGPVRVRTKDAVCVGVDGKFVPWAARTVEWDIGNRLVIVETLGVVSPGVGDPGHTGVGEGKACVHSAVRGSIVDILAETSGRCRSAPLAVCARLQVVTKKVEI